MAGPTTPMISAREDWNSNDISTAKTTGVTAGIHGKRGEGETVGC